jgi:hypothetical protein
MHDTVAAGEYPLDSSVAGGPQLELTTSGPRGRRMPRRPDTAGTQSTPPAPGPIYGARRRQDDQMDYAADRRPRRRTARSLARAAKRERPLGRVVIVTRT